MLASAGLGILRIKQKKKHPGFKSHQVLDGFGWFQALKDVQKRPLPRIVVNGAMNSQGRKPFQVARYLGFLQVGQRMGRFGNPEEWAGRICDNPEPIFLELLCVSRQLRKK